MTGAHSGGRNTNYEIWRQKTAVKTAEQEKPSEFVSGLAAIFTIGLMIWVGSCVFWGADAEKKEKTPPSAEQIAASNKQNALNMCAQRHRRDTQNEAVYGEPWAVNRDGQINVHLPARMGVTDFTATCTVRDGKIAEYKFTDSTASEILEVFKRVRGF